MRAEAAEVLRGAVAGRQNVLIAGGTSTGKTTLVNALVAEVAKTADRIVLIEDTRELRCSAPNLVALRTKDGVASLSGLVRSWLRLRPDRIPVGEAALRRLTCSRPGAPAIQARRQRRCRPAAWLCRAGLSVEDVHGAECRQQAAL
jgi:hypothetical protein